MAQFKQYSKENGLYVGESDLPVNDSAFGNTEVLLPSDIEDGVVFVFDEDIQMWRTMTPEQFEKHRQDVMPDIPAEGDEFRAQVLLQFTTFSKRLDELEGK